MQEDSGKPPKSYYRHLYPIIGIYPLHLASSFYCQLSVYYRCGGLKQHINYLTFHVLSLTHFSWILYPGCQRLTSRSFPASSSSGGSTRERATSRPPQDTSLADFLTLMGLRSHSCQPSACDHSPLLEATLSSLQTDSCNSALTLSDVFHYSRVSDKPSVAP